jgi:hypothetical protein
MAAEQAMLLPAVPYFHVVFTLPHALSTLVRVNRRRLCGRRREVWDTHDSLPRKDRQKIASSWQIASRIMGVLNFLHLRFAFPITSP